MNHNIVCTVLQKINKLYYFNVVESINCINYNIECMWIGNQTLKHYNCGSISNILIGNNKYLSLRYTDSMDGGIDHAKYICSDYSD